MRWLLAASAGALSGWLIASATDEVAIAAAAGAAIGVLATIALFGTSPVRSVFKVAGAMAMGSLAGWAVASLTDHLTAAMAIGGAVGVLATVAIASERPVRSLCILAGAMGFGFVAGWSIGLALGHPKLGLALVIPLGLPFVVLLADRLRLPRRRPF